MLSNDKKITVLGIALRKSLDVENLDKKDVRIQYKDKCIDVEVFFEGLCEEINKFFEEEKKSITYHAVCEAIKEVFDENREEISEKIFSKFKNVMQ